MKIGIIGSGNMGRSLGIFWAEQGHEVFFGARTAQKGQAIAKFADRKGKRSQSLLDEVLKAAQMMSQPHLEMCCCIPFVALIPEKS
jgi:predicted dinucleotide-binding enzyme